MNDLLNWVKIGTYVVLMFMALGLVRIHQNLETINTYLEMINKNQQMLLLQNDRK